MHPRNIGETQLDEASLNQFFYSDLIRAAEGAKQKKAPPLDWLHILKGMPNVKQIEMEQHFLEEYLEALSAVGVRQLTQDDLVEYLKSSPMEMVMSIRTGEELDEDDFRSHISLGEPYPPTREDLESYLEDFKDDALEIMRERDAGNEVYREDSEIPEDEIEAVCYDLAEKAWERQDYPFEMNSDVKCSATLYVTAGQYEFSIYGSSDLGERDFTPDRADDPRSQKLLDMMSPGEHDSDSHSSEAELFAHQIIMEEKKSLGRTGHAEFEEYVEPGPKTGYWELLVRAPKLEDRGQNNLKPKLREQHTEVVRELSRMASIPKDERSKKYFAKRDRLEAIEKRLDKAQDKADEVRPFFESSHFGKDANILVHMRVTARNTVDGRRVAFLEELQSDISKSQGEGDEPEETQARRKELAELRLKGNKDVRETGSALSDAIYDGYFGFCQRAGFSPLTYTAGDIQDTYLEDAVRVTKGLTEDEREAFKRKHSFEKLGHVDMMASLIKRDPEIQALADRYLQVRTDLVEIKSEELKLGTDKSKRAEVPITPYVDASVTNLAMKMFMRWAVENEYDEVAWTRPDQQANRWEDTDNIVDYAEWDPAEGEAGELGDKVVRFRLGGDTDYLTLYVNPKGKILTADDESERFEGKPLSAFFGSKLANQIMNTAGGGYESNPFLMHDDGFHTVYGSQINSYIKKALKKTDAVLGSERLYITDKSTTFSKIVEENVPWAQIVERLEPKHNPDWLESFKEAQKKDIERNVRDKLNRIEDSNVSLRALEERREAGTVTDEQFERHFEIVNSSIAHNREQIETFRAQEYFDMKLGQYLLGHSKTDSLQDLFPELVEKIPHEVVPHIKLGPKAKEKIMEPMSYFRRTNDFKGHISPALMDQMLPYLEARLDMLGIKNVDLSVDAKMADDGRVEMGQNNLAILIGRTLDQDATLDHEAVHILKQRGLFSKREWNALKSAARESWMDRFDIAQRYDDMSPEVQIEEAIAEAYAQYRSLTRKGTDERKAMEKIEAFRKSLILSFVDAGYDSLSALRKANDTLDVFDRISSAEVGSRVSPIEDALGIPAGLLSDRERKALERAAEQEWVAKYGLGPDGVTLAVEEAYAEHLKKKAPGIFGTIFDKVADHRNDLDLKSMDMR